VISSLEIFVACIVSFLVSIFSTSVGGTSLITVPLLISLGMSPKEAVATNMFALIFLSAGGAGGFWRMRKEISLKLLFFFSILTIAGSVIGAYFIISINKDVLKIVIATTVVLMSFSLFIKRRMGVESQEKGLTFEKITLTSLLVFALGAYGGFFSGGYVTVLTYILILIANFNFLQAAFLTKTLNVFSSLSACVLFLLQNLIDFRVGWPMALSVSLGAYSGAKIALSKGDVWIRNLFFVAIILLAIRLFF